MANLAIKVAKYNATTYSTAKTITITPDMIVLLDTLADCSCEIQYYNHQKSKIDLIITAALDATTSNISGMAAGVQATFEALAATKTIGGTIASLVCTSFVGAGNTLPTAHSFIRCVDEGSVKFSNFLNLDGVSTGSNNVFQSASNTTCSHKIRCLINGTVYYLMVDATL